MKTKLILFIILFFVLYAWFICVVPQTYKLRPPTAEEMDSTVLVFERTWAWDTVYVYETPYLVDLIEPPPILDYIDSTQTKLLERIEALEKKAESQGLINFFIGVSLACLILSILIGMRR